MNDLLLQQDIELATGVTLTPELFDRIKEKMNSLIERGADQSDALQTALEMLLPPDSEELNLTPPPPLPPRSRYLQQLDRGVANVLRKS